MVSHTQKPRVRGSRGPNSSRKPKQSPKFGYRMNICQNCGLLRKMSPGFKTLCTGCVAKGALELQPREAAVDDDSDNAGCDNAMAEEDSDDDPMQIDSGISSNGDDDKIPHTDANARRAPAPEVNSVKTAEISAPVKKNTSFQSHPSEGALPSSFPSGITPWTPVDSSTFTDLSANMNTSVAMNIAAVSMNPAAHYANFPGPMASPTSTAPVMPSQAAMPPQVAMPPQAATGQLPRNLSTATIPQARVSTPSTMRPAYTGAQRSFLHPTIINHSAIMNSSAPMSSSAAKSPQTTVSPQRAMNPQGFVAPPTFKDPSASMTPPTVNPYVSIMARPNSTIPSAAMGSSSNNPMATMNISPEMSPPMIKTPIPITIARARIRASPPRMRKRPPAATRPRRRATLRPMVHILPLSSESPPEANDLPATIDPSTATSPPSIIVSPPPTAPPANTDETVRTNAAAVDNPQQSTGATSKTTPAVSLGPAVTNPPSSPVVRGQTNMGSPAAVNPPATMDLPIFTNLSAAPESDNFQIEDHLEPYGPPPTNGGNYLSIIQINYCYTSKAADGAPMRLDVKTIKELAYLEELVMDPPVSSTPAFFLPPRSLSIYLLKLYRNEVYFAYPFFSMNSFMDAFNKLFMLITKFDVSSAHLGLGCSDESSPSMPLFQCALFMILRHAVHFANLEREDKAFASRIFWKCAKFFMTVELLDTSCLAAVQTLLIIAVAINGSNLGGNGSKVPAELASRIAQSLGIDNENGQPASAAAGVHDAGRQAWYGCVMMNLFSQTMNSKLPLNSGMSKAPATTTRYQPPIGTVDFSFFINCVFRIEQLEKILEKIRGERELVSQTSPNDGYNSFDLVAPELREKFCKFIKSLPKELCLGPSGLPNDYIQIAGTDQPKAASNARFMHLRAMLFRPILMQMGIDGCTESNSTTSKINPIVKDKTLECAMSCLNTAISLIDFLYKRYVVEIKSNREWWWNPYHTSTAGLILIMAQTSATLWSHAQTSLVVRAWKACQEMLGYDAADNRFHQDALGFLWDANNGISGLRVLENNYEVMPPCKFEELPVSRNFHRTTCSPFLDPNKSPHPIYSDSDSKAPLKASKPKLSPSTFPYAAASSSNTAPIATSTSSTSFNPMPSVLSEAAPWGSSAAANAAFSNFNTVPYACPPSSSTGPPFTASSNSDTALFTYPLMPGGVPPFTASASTAHPISTSSGSGPFPFPWNPSIIPHAALKPAAVPYAVASNSIRAPYTAASESTTVPYTATSGLGTIPYMASSESTIAPYATSLNSSVYPYAASSESATFLHASTSNPSTVPTAASSFVSPVSRTGPYTAFSDPNATLYTEESLDVNATTWPDLSVFNVPPSFSNTMPSLSPSNPNLANFGSIGDIGGLGAETQALIQTSTEGLPLHIFYNPDDDPFITGNWQS